MRTFSGLALVAISTGSLLIPRAALHAQQNAGLQVGARVRVFLPDHRYAKGSVTKLSGDSIGFTDGRGERTVAHSAVNRVQIGRRSRPLGALKFGLIGAGAGAAAGALIGAATYEESEYCLVLCGRSTAAALGGMAIGTLGLAVGIIGGAIHGEEIWTDLPRR